jgi:hypothetical protein
LLSNGVIMKILFWLAVYVTWLLSTGILALECRRIEFMDIKKKITPRFS